MNNESLSNDEEKGWPLERKSGWTKIGPKFAPRHKSMEELRQEKQIAAGPHFEELVNEDDIVIDGGTGRMVPLCAAFDDCNFSPKLHELVRTRSWGVPTSIQKAIIPLVQLKTNDIVASAATGSGKTAAYLLPIIDEIVRHKAQTEQYLHLQKSKPYALVVSPTKELAEQIYNDARTLTHGTDVGVVRCYGDMPMMVCRNAIGAGCDIFIATSGRLRHFVNDQIVCGAAGRQAGIWVAGGIELNNQPPPLKIHLDLVHYVVLDEADRLIQQDNYDIIEYVMSSPGMRADRRLLLFSATYPSEVMWAANSLLRPDYFIVQVGGANHAVDSVRQRFILLSHYEKQAYLLHMLHKMAKPKRRADGSAYHSVQKTLIFVGKKREANRLSVVLAMNDFLATNINGDRTLQQRHDAIESFTKDVFDILVSTDVASRGLNIPDVVHVINYDLPENSLDGYVHRIGRTGRVGNEGTATSLFDPKADAINASFYVQKLSEVGQRVPPFLEEIAFGSGEALRLQMERERPYAKFEAEQRYLSIGINSASRDGDDCGEED